MTKPTNRLASLDLSQLPDGNRRDRPSTADIDRFATLPSREPVSEKEGDDQVNIRGRMSVIRRFKSMSRDTGWSHARLLEELMDRYESQ